MWFPIIFPMWFKFYLLVQLSLLHFITSEKIAIAKQCDQRNSKCFVFVFHLVNLLVPNGMFKATAVIRFQSVHLGIELQPLANSNVKESWRSWELLKCKCICRWEGAKTLLASCYFKGRIWKKAGYKTWIEALESGYISGKGSGIWKMGSHKSILQQFVKKKKLPGWL